MTNNVFELNGKAKLQHADPNQDLITALEDALADARSGKLRSLMGAGFTNDGFRFAISVCEETPVYQMLGSIEALKQEYINKTEHTYKD